MSRRAWSAALAVLAVSVLAALPGNSAIAAAKFGPVLRLGPWLGGEPSIAFDPSGNGAVYVVAPQTGPAASWELIDTLDTVGRATGTFYFEQGRAKGGSSGVGFWASFDGGRTWRLNKNVGSGLGGFDSDVAVGPDRTVYVADLEVIASSICTSSNQGRDFTSSPAPGDTCSALNLNHQGPSNDREWITIGRNGELYLTYHEIATGFPIMLVSRDKAKTFTPCGSMLDPQSTAGRNYNPLAGTLVAKPVIGRDGSIFVTVTQPDPDASPVGGALNHLYVAVAHGGCGPDTIFSNYTIYENPDAEFTLFNSLAIDGGGILYAVATGRTAKGQTSDATWLFVSRNKGVTWSRPINVNPPVSRGNVMPAVAGGKRANQVAIGWYGTVTSGDPGNLKNAWRYWVATSFDAGRRFYYTRVTGNLHFGAICTLGVACNPLSDAGNRNLADFTSIAVNPRTGCVLIAVPGDPWNRPDLDPERNDFTSMTYVASQVGGTCLR